MAERSEIDQVRGCLPGVLLSDEGSVRQEALDLFEAGTAPQWQGVQGEPAQK